MHLPSELRSRFDAVAKLNVEAEEAMVNLAQENHPSHVIALHFRATDRILSELLLEARQRCPGLGAIHSNGRIWRLVHRGGAYAVECDTELAVARRELRDV